MRGATPESGVGFGRHDLGPRRPLVSMHTIPLGWQAPDVERRECPRRLDRSRVVRPTIRSPCAP